VDEILASLGRFDSIDKPYAVIMLFLVTCHILARKYDERKSA
jgi:hypothetical protein